MKREKSYYTKKRNYSDFEDDSFIKMHNPKPYTKVARKVTRSQLKSLIDSGRDLDELDEVLESIEEEYGVK
jgi:hypothetical protein